MVAEVCTVHKDAKDLDLPTMTYSKGILPQYPDQLETDFDRTPKKNAINELELLAVVWG